MIKYLQGSLVAGNEKTQIGMNYIQMEQLSYLKKKNIYKDECNVFDRYFHHKKKVFI